MRKAKDLRDQSLEELQGLYEELCRMLFDLRNALNAKKEHEQPHKMHHVRKDIARVLTVMTEKRQQAKG